MSILKEFRIGSLEIIPPVVLAPLAGFTDSSFRQIVKNFGVGLMYTEMISSMGIFYGDKKTMDIARFNEGEKPISAQIFGNDPEKIAYAAAFLENKGFDAIDINMGCPTPKIIKNGSGGALLKDKNLIRLILHKTRATIHIPFTIKIRKGFYKGENTAIEIGHIAENEGVDAISIHGISVQEGFKKEAEDWKCIKDLEESTKIPVIGNGGIKTEEDVKNMFEKTGVEGVMTGRAILGAPWFIKSSVQYIESGTKFRLSLKEKLYIILKHINLVVNEKGEDIGVREMKKALPFYIKGIRKAAYFRDIINRVQSKRDMVKVVEDIFSIHEEVWNE